MQLWFVTAKKKEKTNATEQYENGSVNFRHQVV